MVNLAHDIKQLANRTLTGHAKHAFSNTLQNIDLGHNISEIDPGMAKFRLLNAEEEAVVCLILALKKAGYENAKRFNHKEHKFKNLVLIAIGAANKVIAKQPITLGVDLDKELILARFGSDKHHIYSDDPLNIIISRPETEDHCENMLAPILSELELTIGDDKIDEYSKKAGERRNTLLYSSKSGYPLTTLAPDELNEHETNALAMIGVAVAVTLAKSRSPFIENVIYATLKNVNLTDGEDLVKPSTSHEGYTKLDNHFIR